MGRKSKVVDEVFGKDVDEYCLHLYAQYCWHSEAQITGTNAALRRLGEALIEASKKSEGQKTSVNFMPMDGEGYDVEIMPRSQASLRKMPMPYTIEIGEN